MTTHNARIVAARLALEGLSVGEALARSHTGPGSWRYSDDIEMAAAILEVAGSEPDD